MKTEKMVSKSSMKHSEQIAQTMTENKAQCFSVKTPFQKNQVSVPFQGYNYFGSKPKWDE